MRNGELIGGSVGLMVAGGWLAYAVRGRASTVF